MGLEVWGRSRPQRHSRMVTLDALQHGYGSSSGWDSGAWQELALPPVLLLLGASSHELWGMNNATWEGCAGLTGYRSKDLQRPADGA